MVLRWGIIGTGRIAGVFAEDLLTTPSGSLDAVASRSRENAEKFAHRYHIQKAYASYPELLEDPEVDAVYISTPHPHHAEWAIRAAHAGKHILCEKPIGMNTQEAEQIIEAADSNGVFLMEAFMYRCHPQIQKMIDLIREGAIGQVRFIRATFSFTDDFDEEHRALDPALGGGGILDVGCYCTSVSRLIAGVATGQEIAEPIELTGDACIGKSSRVDEYAFAQVRFPGEILAHLATGVRLEMEDEVSVYGTGGRLFLPSPWLPGKEGRIPSIVLLRSGQQVPEIMRIDAPGQLYALEADVVAANIANRQASFPSMTWEDTLGNMRMLDRWLEAVGMSYPPS